MTCQPCRTLNNQSIVNFSNFSTSFCENILFAGSYKSMQRPGSEAIRTKIQSSKPKITKITNSQNTKRKYGQPSEQLFPKRGRSATHKIKPHTKRHRNSDTKKATENHKRTCITAGLKHILRRNLAISF